MTENDTNARKTEYCKKFLQLAENLDEMVYKMDLHSGEFEYVNQSSVDITGYTPEEFYQNPFLIKNIIHPNWKHYIDVNFSRLIEGDCPPAYEFQIIDKNEQVKWLFQKNILIYDEEGKPISLEGIVKDITELKNTEQLLRQQTNEYRLIFDSVPAMIWFKDDNNKMVRVNKLAAKTKGMAVEDMEGSYMEEFYPDEAEKYLKEDREVIESGKPIYNIIEKHQTGDGKKIWVKTDRIPHKNEKGETIGVLVFATDISNQKNIEEQLLKIEQKNSVILNSIPDILFQFDKDGNFIDYKVKDEKELYFLPRGFLNKNIKDVFPQDFAEQLSEGIKSAITNNELQIFETQLKYEERVLDFEIRLVVTGDNEILAILRNISLRKKAESALKTSEEKFRNFAESAPVAFTRVLLSNGLYEFANSEFERDSGFTIEEFNKLTDEEIDNLIHPEDRVPLKETYRNWAISGCNGVLHYVYRFYNKAGKLLWLDSYFYAEFDPAGKPTAVNQIYVNITGQKKYEELLKMSEEKFRMLSKNAPVAIARLTLSNSLYEFVNDEFVRLSGYTMEEMNNLTAEELGNLIYAEDMEKMSVEYNKWRAAGFKGTIHVDYRIINKNKNIVWMDTYFYAEFDANDKPVAILQVCIDVTAKKQAEITLQQSEAKFRAVAETMKAGIIIIKGENIVYCNKYTSEISGYTVDELKSIKFPEFIHPDYVETVKNRIISRFKEEPVLPDYEFRVLTKSSSMRWLRSNSEIMDYEGDKAILSIIIDITDFKKAESALKLSEAKFRAVAESMPAEIVIFQGSKFIYANPYAEIITGYKVEEIIGSDFWRFTHPDFKDLARQRGFARLEGEKAPERYEMKIITKSGEEKWLDYSATLFEYNGMPAVLGTAVDITQKKIAEHALSQSEERYRAFIRQSSEGIYRIEFEQPIPTNIDVGEQVELMFKIGYIAECNEITARMYGYRNSGELIGKRLEQFLVHSDPANYEYLYDFIKEGYKSVNKQSNEIDKNGDVVYFANNAIGIVERGSLMRIWGMRRDISELKKSEEKLKQSLFEKEVLLKEIHHRVKNNLQIITSLLKLQSTYISDSKTRELFKESQNRVQSMALIHQRLYQSKDLGSINFTEYTRTLISQIMQTFGINLKRISVSVEAENIFMTIDNAIPCGLIINELVTNSLKHAFKDNTNGHVKVSVVMKDNEYLLNIEDDGIGLPDNFDLKKSSTFGLKLVKTLVDQVRGKIMINSKKGASFDISFSNISSKERLELVN